MKRVYINLMAEMARKGLVGKDIAKVLGLSTTSINFRLSGKIEFSISEAYKIRDKLFPTLTIDYLFDKRPRYDLIDVFNFPDKREYKIPFNDESEGPDDCA